MNLIKKGKFAAICITAGVITAVSAVSAAATGYDFNGDGSFDVQDVTHFQNIVLNQNNFDDISEYDVNNDEKINVNDVSFLQMEISKSDPSSIYNIAQNTKISVPISEINKNVGDTFTINISTNNSISDITYSTSDSKIVKIVSTDKNTVELKAQKTGSATLTVNQCSQTATVKISVDKAKCIDLSLWNGDVDFNKVKNSGITCVILRAGYGKDPNQEDEKFNEYYRKAKDAGLNVGAYWYSYATSVDAAKAEVRNCMKTIAGKSFELPVFYDVEEYRMAVLPRRTLTDIISAFCDGIKSNGFESGIYCAKSMLVDSAYPDELTAKYCIWLADNSGNAVPSYVDIHQYSWYGRVNGIYGDVDMNYIYSIIP